MDHERAEVKASGGVVWRQGGAGVELVVVHRPRYDDWSLPKGKLEPGESFEQAAVAERVGLSPAAFSRWFKRRMGKPYTDYINEARLDLVCRAVLESDRDVSRIARECGFAGGSHFHRLFKSCKRVSPTEYRRLARAGFEAVQCSGHSMAIAQGYAAETDLLRMVVGRGGNCPAITAAAKASPGGEGGGGGALFCATCCGCSKV